MWTIGHALRVDVTMSTIYLVVFYQLEKTACIPYKKGEWNLWLFQAAHTAARPESLKRTVFVPTHTSRNNTLCAKNTWHTHREVWRLSSPTASKQRELSRAEPQTKYTLGKILRNIMGQTTRLAQASSSAESDSLEVWIGRMIHFACCCGPTLSTLGLLPYIVHISPFCSGREDILHPPSFSVNP